VANTKLSNYRLKPRTLSLIRKIAVKMGLENNTAVITVAVYELAKREGLLGSQVPQKSNQTPAPPESEAQNPAVT
jgi:hypothetical protein